LARVKICVAAANFCPEAGNGVLAQFGAFAGGTKLFPKRKKNLEQIRIRMLSSTLRRKIFCGR
jgi:hypothetical protein